MMQLAVPKQNGCQNCGVQLDTKANERRGSRFPISSPLLRAIAATYHTKLRRHPVQHLADAFADRMERTTATAAGITSDGEHNVLARQMIGQRFAFRASVVVLGDDDRTALPDAGNVAVEVFKRERQLIGIKAFGAAPELRPLELLDDGLEALDLTVAAVGGAQTGNTNVIPGLPGFAQEVATFVASG